MREIIFRGKRLDNGEWVEGGYKHEKVGEYLTAVFIIEHLTSEVWENHRVDPATVGQYTGLEDKNGKRIFEGDIINGLFLFGMNIKAVVVFKDGAFGLEWKRGNVTEFSAFTSICNVEYEVVGNIHDNKELLKVVST